MASTSLRPANAAYHLLLAAAAVARKPTPSLCRGSRSLSLQLVSFGQHFSTDTLASVPKSHSRRERLYLHVSPSGDWWTGNEIFAAKHLQPDYVKSIPVPNGLEDIETWLDDFGNEEEKTQMLHRVYDTGKLPDEVLERLEVRNDEAKRS